MVHVDDEADGSPSQCYCCAGRGRLRDGDWRGFGASHVGCRCYSRSPVLDRGSPSLSVRTLYHSISATAESPTCGLSGPEERGESTSVDEDSITQFTMRRVPVIVLDNGASTIKVGVTTSPKDVR